MLIKLDQQTGGGILLKLEPLTVEERNGEGKWDRELEVLLSNVYMCV